MDLVNRILTIKDENTSAKTANLEEEVDQLVYGIYGLTPAEISEVEQSLQKP